MSNYTTGIDVSDWQGVIDWDAVSKSAYPKISFVYCKATDGSRGDQQFFAQNHDECRARDLPFGAYHFFRFDEDAHAQARNFIAATLSAGRGGTLIPMVDVEVGTASATALSDFLTDVQAAFKVPFVLIYTDSGFWDGSGLADGFSGHPLWIANFVHDGNDPEGSPTLPSSGGWVRPVIWQYDNEGHVPGIGNTDLDVLLDSMATITRPGL